LTPEQRVKFNELHDRRLRPTTARSPDQVVLTRGDPFWRLSVNRFFFLPIRGWP
jgi:hypothetical protein